ncbi:hypothetical protein BpHYR1_037849 [Brachionus plicatilis]|uniref:Uncharacterized protein n=1 Tax=Brachionus plicatilis TaxID=10195 RepID=A0A3M7RRA0_BRAPC|nr:hypothetical protein BpHYR1_037849 [Brachionus plicatilis]
MEKRFDENFQPKTSDTRYRFDFIFYPRVLEICLNYITHIKRQQRMELISKITTLDELEKFDQKYKQFQSTSLNFLKRLLYLIETSNYNLQLILNQNFRSYFIQLLHKPVFKEELMDNTFTFYQTELEIIEHTYDIMYHISSLDITASFLTNLFEVIVDNQFQDIILENKHLSASSLKIISLLNKIKKLSANLVMRLVPISNENRIVKSGQQTSDFSHFSYSIGFMIRFDNNSINYSSNSNDSYMHLFSINLEDENSSFEIWLSQNGSILFMSPCNTFYRMLFK